jgi:phosphoribosylformylglycinamidine (FGAM) synthase-like enzyme
MAVYRIMVASKKRRPDVFKVFNLEIDGPAPDLSMLYPVLANPVTMKVVEQMPRRLKNKKFREVMFSNAVIDPEQQNIITLCAHRGVKVEAAKVSYRYYGKKMAGLYVNKLVHVAFNEEPELTTLKPRGVRRKMEYYNLLAMSDAELMQLSKDRELHLSISKMKMLVNFQRRLGLPAVTDVFLEAFAGAWSEHCFHDLWKSLGLFLTLKEATERIGNPNLISAFVDNAGVWDFYDGLCILFKLETHNSPTKKEPYGGQLTKLGGVLRDIIENGLGAKPIGNIEHTVVGELRRVRYPELIGKTLPETVLARETIRAISAYGNPMGIPMLIARLMAHPLFSGKPFALGGAVGITTREAAEKGCPRRGDLAYLVGGDTGNDGLHGATVSSSGITDLTDTGDSTHVQIGLPYIEQLMMRAGQELRDRGCCRARNDFGALGIVSAFGEMARAYLDYLGGLAVNLALVPLKHLGLSNWQIATSESQERFAHCIIPEKEAEALAIYKKYGLKATKIGVFTGNGRLQLFYDSENTDLHPDMELTGEICMDVPYAFFDECPLDKIEIREPEPKADTAVFPAISRDNVMEMALKVVGHFDVCDQSQATTQYDASVQGITWQPPLYGINYNVGTSLAVLRPVYGKPYGLTVSLSFSPWQFEVDPVQAAVNAMMDTLVTQVVAGVEPINIALADNFYTDGTDPVARWYLREQVLAITELSVETGTPFMVGKDSSAAKGTFGGTTVCAPPSVCITGMGKALDVRRLILHQWKEPGNALVAIGPRAERLDGSILSSSLGITGTRLDKLVVKDPGKYLIQLYRLSQSGIICSAVPINRGGIFLRLFEGVEASGFGVDTMLCEELFPESFGGVLVEVNRGMLTGIREMYPELNPRVVGVIRPKKGITVQGRRLNFNILRAAWKRSFRKALWENYEEEGVMAA